MRTKLIYTALVGLLVSSGISNAMERERLALTDGNQTGSQLTPYQGSTSLSTSTSCRVLSGNDKVDFTNASKEIVNMIIELPNGDKVGLEGVVNYLGKNRYGLGHFMEGLEFFIANYKPGVNFNAPQEITISAEDNINIGHFSKYFCQNLLIKKFEEQTVTPEEFKVFKSSNEKAFDSYAYENNCILFALTNYLTKSGAPSVEIKHNMNNYSNLRFIFSPCPSTDREKGTQVDSSFKSNDLPYNTSATGKVAQIPSPGTFTNFLMSTNTWGSSPEVMYNVTFFKVEGDTFRINVKLSSKDSAGAYNPRQVSDILLHLKK